MLDPRSALAATDPLLTFQQQQIQLPSDYYDGRHRLAFASAKFRNAFAGLFRELADNWCKTVVDAPVERLFIEGFLFGDSEEADQDARNIWQASQLDADSIMAHTEAGKTGRAYIMVHPKRPDEDYPRISVEHPSQVVVLHAAGDRRKRLAALKKWRGDDGYDYANVFLPDGVYKFRSVEKVRANGTTPGKQQWSVAEGSGTHPFGVVPVIPLYNNPSMLTGGQSDLDTAIPLQDAINKQLADMLIASEYVAHPQRYATGVEVPTIEDGNGNQTPDPNFELKTAVSRLLVSEDKDAKFGQLEGADLTKYVEPISMLLQHLAAQTRTPPHYLLGQIVNASGDALKAAETGLVAKTKRKQIDFAEPWEEAMRLALKALDKPGADDQAVEVKWRDPEYRSMGEQVDASIKLAAIGVPQEICWEKAGFSQTEILRMKGMAEADEFLTQANERQQAALAATAAQTQANAQIDANAGAPAVA